MPSFDVAILNLPLWWPFSGVFAVAIFFIVSGFALSIGFWETKRRSIVVGMAAGRYMRLAIPVFATCAGVSILLNLGLILPPEARPDRFAMTFGFEPTLWHLVKFVAFDVFFDYDVTDTYAGPLWTMGFELIGSFLVFAILLTGRMFWPLAIGLAVGLFFSGSLYSLFVIGAVLAKCYPFIPRHTWSGVAMMGVGAYGTLYIPGWQSLILGTSLFFTGVILCAPAQAALSSDFSQWLGKISFPLYLVHAPMIFAVGLPIYVWAGESMLLAMSAGIAATIASFVAALALMPANEAAMRVSRFIGRTAIALAEGKLFPAT